MKDLMTQRIQLYILEEAITRPSVGTRLLPHAYKHFRVYNRKKYWI